MSADRSDFEQFLKAREDAAASYASGDATPLGHIVARELPATFFGPGGGHRRGPSQVWSEYERGAGAFERGGESRFEVMQSAGSGNVAYWTGLQHATVRVRGSDEAKPMVLRVTEIFRKEDGEWKLVHRHADGLAEEKKPEPEAHERP